MKMSKGKKAWVAFAASIPIAFVLETIIFYELLTGGLVPPTLPPHLGEALFMSGVISGGIHGGCGSVIMVETIPSNWYDGGN